MQTGKGTVAVSVYLSEGVAGSVDEFSVRFGLSKSKAVELLIKKGLGQVGDNELERMLILAKVDES